MKEEPEKMIFLQSAHKDPAVILLGVPIWANSSWVTPLLARCPTSASPWHMQIDANWSVTPLY